MGTGDAHPNQSDDPSNWTTFVAPTVEALNETLPEFEFQQLLGQGGMGAVYKVRQKKLDRIVALKLLAPLSGPDSHKYAERFELEAQAMSKMSHPNIVTFHDFKVTDDGQKFIVMEYVDGTDLHTAIQTGQLNTAHALSWIPQICHALQYSHELGVIHRDIKPANVLINSEGNVRIVDFGLITLVGNSQLDHRITETDVAMGTVEYSPPESFDKDVELDHRGDIYSLGVLMYEMLTGQPPQGTWRPPSELARGQFDRRLDDIVTTCMQPDRNDRYPTMSAVAQAVDLLRLPEVAPEQRQMVAKRLSIGPPKVKVARRKTPAPVPQTKESNPAIWVIFAMVALVVVLIVVFIVKSRNKPTPSTAASSSIPELQSESVEELLNLDPEPEPEPLPEPTPPVAQVDPEPEPEPMPEPPAPAPPVLELDTESGVWIDMLAGLDVESARIRGSWEPLENDAIIGRKGENGGRPLLALPAFPGPVYDVELVLQREIGDDDVMITLPVRDKRHIHLKLADWEKWIGFKVGNQTPEQGSPARAPTVIETGRDHQLLIKIRVHDDDVHFHLSVDGAPTLEWTGPIDSLPNRHASRTRLDLNQIHIGSYNDPVIWSSVRVRDASQTLPPEEMAAARERLDAVLEKQRLQVEQSATKYREGLTKLNANYARILNRFASGDDEDLKIAAQGEIERMRQQLPIDEGGAESVPAQLVAAREVYQEELVKLEAVRDSEATPVLEEHLEELESLNQSLLDENRVIEAAMVAESIADLNARLERVQLKWDPF